MGSTERPETKGIKMATFYAKTFGDFGPRGTIHSFDSRRDRDQFVEANNDATAVTAEYAKPFSGNRGIPQPHRIHHLGHKPDRPVAGTIEGE